MNPQPNPAGSDQDDAMVKDNEAYRKYREGLEPDKATENKQTPPDNGVSTPPAHGSRADNSIADEPDELDAILESYEFDVRTAERHEIITVRTETRKKLQALSDRRTKAALDSIRKWTEYNKHDMGELGEFIRTQYVYNKLDEEASKLNQEGQ